MSISSRLTSLDSEILRLQNILARNGVASGDLLDMVVGVNDGTKEEDNTIEKQKSKLDSPSGLGGDSGTADVWTNVAFTVDAKKDDHKEENHDMSGSFHAEAQRWLPSVTAEPSFVKNNKTVEEFMSSCDVSCSFSAMVVNIKRPWLHAELFQDFDTDIPEGSFLSPGAQTVKRWVETGDDQYNGYERSNYGKFPAYPTAFIVAADTRLSFKSEDSKSQEVMDVLQSDSSAQASFGCWRIGVGAGSKYVVPSQSHTIIVG
jgi:hypothetical protein